MKSTLKLFLILFFGLNQFACSQKTDHKLIQDLKSNIQKIEVSKFFLFQKELVELCNDSTVFNAITKKLFLKSKSIERYNDQDRIEYQLILKLLSDEIEKVNNNSNCKNQLLDVIKQQLKTQPMIDEKFILGQLDSEKRGITNGYDGGVTSESRFILFNYDPILLMNTLKKNDMDERWKRMGVFLCNYLRDDELPTTIKVEIYNRLKLRLRNNKYLTDMNDIISDYEACAITKPRNN